MTTVLIGGLLCCVGDVLFDLKGKGNEKLGTSKNIDSNLIKMADWRFGHLPRLAPKQAADLGCGAGRNAGELLKLQRH